MADFVDPSVTAAIVAAKDKLVVESNRAEVIVDQWYATGNLVQDAPSNGVAYNRKDAEWVEAASGGGSGDMLKATYDPTNINSDAFARSNHTGTQSIGTVTGLQTSLDTKVAEAPIDSNLYARKNGTWEVVPPSSGITKEQAFTPITLTGAAVPASIEAWRLQPAGLYICTWSFFTTPDAFNGLPDSNASADAGSSFTWFVQVQDVGAESIIYATRKGVAGEWTLDTTGKSGVATTLYTKQDKSTLLEMDDVATTNYTGKVGYVLTVFDETRTAFLAPPASGATDLSNTPSAIAVDVESSTGTNTTIASATTSLAGVMSAADKVKLTGIATGAEVNVQSDWNAVSGDAFIANKPTVLPEAPIDGLQYARQDGAWAEVAGGGGSAPLDLMDFPYITTLGLITTISGGDWKTGVINAITGAFPVAEDRVNKTYFWQFGGTAAATPLTFPTPAELGIPLGASIGIVLSGAAWLSDARVSEFSFNAASPFNPITGITRINRAAKLFLPINTPAAGSDNYWSTLRLTAYKPKPSTTTLAWRITEN